MISNTCSLQYFLLAAGRLAQGQLTDRAVIYLETSNKENEHAHPDKTQLTKFV